MSNKRFIIKIIRVADLNDPKIADVQNGEHFVIQDTGHIYYKHHTTGAIIDTLVIVDIMALLKDNIMSDVDLIQAISSALAQHGSSPQPVSTSIDGTHIGNGSLNFIASGGMGLTATINPQDPSVIDVTFTGGGAGSGGGGSGSSSGAVTNTVNATNTFSVGQPVYYDGSEYQLAKADAVNTLGMWIVTQATSSQFSVAQSGLVTGLTGLTPGHMYYVSHITAGALTDVEPSTAFSNPILLAVSPTSGWVMPYRGRSSALDIKNLEITSEKLHLDTVNSGSSGGAAWGAIDCIDFAPLQDGSVYFSFKIPDGWAYGNGLRLSCYYTLDGADNGNTLSISAEINTVAIGEKINSGAELSLSEIITASNANTDKLAKYDNMFSIPANLITSNDDIVQVKLTRNLSGNTYNGTFKLIKIIVRN